MSKTLPTEESLGLSPTEDELNTAVTNDDDDIPQNDDAEPALAPAKPGPEKAAKPEPEPQDGDKPPEPNKPEDEQPKQVDVRALQEARAEAREAKRQAAILEQRWNDFLAVQREPTKEPEQPAMPGPDDPMGRLNWTVEQLTAFQEQQRQTAAQQAETQRQEQAFQQAFATVDADYRAASAADPTLAEAYSALRESQGKELLALGYSIPEAQVQLAQMERQNVMYVAQRGLNIADHIKALAAVRGWQPKAQQPAQQKTDIAAVAAAQQRHQSLSDAGGGEAVAPLDAKALARMTDKQFKEWMSKKGNEAKFDEIMGR